MKTTRRAFRHSLCIVHSALCIAFAATEAGALPAGYTQHEYIKGNATASTDSANAGYIATDIFPNPQTDTIDAEFELVGTFQQAIWCARGSTYTDRTWTLLYGQTSKKFRFDYYSGSNQSTPSTYATEIVHATFENNSCTLAKEGGSAETLSYNAQSSFTQTGGPIVLFALMNNSSGTLVSGLSYGNSKLYSFTITRGGEVIHNLVPAVRTSDSQPGLYDDVPGGQFYPGTGSFTMGEITDFSGILEVSCSTTQPCGSPSPAYGMTTGLAAGDSFVCSAPAVWTNAAGTATYVCTGYRVLVNGAVQQEGTGNSFTYVHPDCETGASLVWQWALTSRVVNATAGEGGTVSGAGWHEADATAPVTATPSEGYGFYGWEGDVPADQRHRESPFLPSDGPRTLKAIFAPVRYVAMDGSDTNNGLTPGTALASVATACAAFPSGTGVVYVAAGAYTNVDEMTISSAIRLHGVGGFRNTTLVLASTATNKRVMTVNHNDAVVSGLTITGGQLGAYCAAGSGARIQKGTLEYCRVTGNAYGPGVNNGCGGGISLESATARASHCVIDHNTVQKSGNRGGGVFIVNNGILEDSLVYANSISGNGGGIGFVPLNGGTGGGTVRNCTITGNSAGASGGGVYIPNNMTGGFVNCVIYGNTAPADGCATAPDVYGNGSAHFTNLFQRCVVGSAAFGAGNVRANPLFRDAAGDDYTLQPGSPAIDIGGEPAGATDLSDAARVQGAALDAGAYEFDPDVFSCGFTATPEALFMGSAVTLSASVTGASGPVACGWVVSNETFSGVQVSASGQETSVTLDRAGVYGVYLTVTGGGEACSFGSPSCIAVGAATNYVDPNCATPAYPYSTWETAATSLAVAYEAAFEGGTIVLSADEHPLTDALDIGKGVRITSPFGREAAVIRQTTTGKRVLRIHHAGAVVEGVTIRGGKLDGHGAGAYMEGNGGTLTNCVVTGNYCSGTYNCGGGVYLSSAGGRVSGCAIVGNSCNSAGYGGGIYLAAGLVDHSLIATNKGASSANSSGGGLQMRGGTLESCVVAANIGNGAIYLHSGSPVVRNCTITGNDATTGSGGGIYWSTAATAARVVNCILFGNVADADSSAGSPDWYHPALTAAQETSFSNVFVNCLFEVAPVGAGARTGDPAFLDAAAGNYAPHTGSPAIDAGTDALGVGATDYAGAPRVRGAAVDIGAYEADPNAFGCIFAAAETAGFEGATFSLVPSVAGLPSGAEPSYAWGVTNAATGTGSAHAGESPAVTIPEAGWYDVTLRVEAGGQTATYSIPRFLHVATHTNYVSALAASPAAPYASWATATPDLFAAYAETIDGSVIVVQGTNNISGQLFVDRDVQIVGASGRDADWIVQKKASTRVVWLNAPGAALRGVTVTGGSGGGGNGVLIGGRGGTVADCRIYKNRANPSYGTGGGVSLGSAGARVVRCIIDANSQHGGGGMGGGAYITAGTLESCLIAENYVNNASGGGIAVRGANVAIRNCTVVTNYAMTSGAGGIYIYKDAVSAPGLEIANTVFEGNYARDAKLIKDWGAESGYSAENLEAAFAACVFNSADPPSATGSRTAVPRFTADWHIPADSPLHDTGVYQDWMADALDLDGNPRVDHRRRVDVGCYEVPYRPPQTILILQ